MQNLTKSLILGVLLTAYANFVTAQNKPGSSPNFLQGTDSPAQYQPLQFKMGFNLGWCFPYSAGVEFGLLFNELVDVNAGVGLGISGAKYGGGLRLYPMRETAVSPMIGTYLFHATGTKDLTISSNGFQAVYDITPETAALVNGGFRFRFGSGHYLTAAAGLIFPFYGEQAKYRYGSRNADLQNMANSLATSGFSFNIGIQIKLSSGHYEQ